MKHLVRLLPVLLIAALFVLLKQSNDTRKKLSRAEAEIQRLSGELEQARSAGRASFAPSQAEVASAPAPEMPSWTRVDPAPPTAQPVPVDPASPPPMTEALAGAIDRFDVAMDQQFTRLEEREKNATDPAEITMIQRIKAKLEKLDELYRRADTTTDPAERMAISMEIQTEMGSIIGLSRADRNERIGKLAADIGYTDPQAVKQVIQEIDRIYYETHMDWTKLFNRAPPGAD